MEKKAVWELLKNKVDEAQFDKLWAELKNAADQTERIEVFKKFGVRFTEDERKFIETLKDGAISDDELAQAAGGCSCFCCPQ